MLSVLINTHLLHGRQKAWRGTVFLRLLGLRLQRRQAGDPDVTALKEEDAYPAMPEDGYGWEKLFSERMCRHFREDFGLTTRVARYHNVYGPQGTYDGGREKAPPRSAAR
jgi:GDP-D-mannose 3',5'-epimerase